jgi:hypothetical protein
MRERFNGFRDAVRHASGPVGSALLMSLMSVLLCGSALATWMTRRHAPMPAVVLFPLIALGMWRQVQFIAEPQVSLWFRRVRIALLTLATVVAAFGVSAVYGWGWHGINVVTPFLAAWNLMLELRDPSHDVRSTHPAF